MLHNNIGRGTFEIFAIDKLCIIPIVAQGGKQKNTPSDIYTGTCRHRIRSRSWSGKTTKETNTSKDKNKVKMPSGVTISFLVAEALFLGSGILITVVTMLWKKEMGTAPTVNTAARLVLINHFPMQGE